MNCFCSFGVNMDMAVSSAHVIWRTQINQRGRETMKKKILAGMLAAAVTGMLLSGCGKKSEVQPEPENGAELKEETKTACIYVALL